MQVRFGTPVTTEQAVVAILKRLNTPIVGDITRDSNPGYTLQRIHADTPDGCIYNMLSSGEKHLVDIAQALWTGKDPIGGLDKNLRRYVLVVLMYLYVGEDRAFEGFNPPQWANAFGVKPDIADMQ